MTILTARATATRSAIMTTMATDDIDHDCDDDDDHDFDDEHEDDNDSCYQDCNDDSDDILTRPPSMLRLPATMSLKSPLMTISSASSDRPRLEHPLRMAG